MVNCIKILTLPIKQLLFKSFFLSDVSEETLFLKVLLYTIYQKCLWFDGAEGWGSTPTGRRYQLRGFLTAHISPYFFLRGTGIIYPHLLGKRNTPT